MQNPISPSTRPKEALNNVEQLLFVKQHDNEWQRLASTEQTQLKTFIADGQTKLDATVDPQTQAHIQQLLADLNGALVKLEHRMANPQYAPKASPPEVTLRPVSAPTVRYDIKNQLERIQAYCIDGETLAAVWDCKGGGSGFVGVTDQRIIFYDQGVVMKHKAMISIPYNQIIGVSSADEGFIFTTSEITLITAAGRFSFVFRGADKAHWTYRYIMNQVLNRAHPQLRG